MEGANATSGEPTSEYIDTTKTSMECLREAKPAEDISIKNKASNDVPPANAASSNKSPQPKAPGESVPLAPPSSDAKIETVFEKLSIHSDQAEPAADDNVSTNVADAAELNEAKTKNTAKTKMEVPPLNFEIKSRSSEPKGDVLSKTEPKISAVSLYSVKGSPSGRINRRRETSSNVFPAGCMGCKEDDSPRRFLDANEASNDFIGHVDSIPKKRPSSGKQDASKNPVTGTGIQPAAGRRQCIKRKDGNPLLGIGYEAEPPTPTASRIPPGGYSQGLW